MKSAIQTINLYAHFSAKDRGRGKAKNMALNSRQRQLVGQIVDKLEGRWVQDGKLDEIREECTKNVNRVVGAIAALQDDGKVRLEFGRKDFDLATH